MTNREIAQEISSRIGNSPVPFDSVYSIALQIYNELGGEQTQFDSVYSILLEILPLVEGGGGGKAIEEVDELPEDPAENKDKLFRLDNGDKDVYAAKLLSSETITTNKLPDEQQIDNAYLYNTNNDYIFYYKGAYKIVCSDGEIDGYGWITGNPSAEGNINFTLDNIANISSNSTSYDFISSGVWNLDENLHTITNLGYTIEDFVGDYESTISDDGLIPIPAIYNAPESAQIGNAYIEYDAEIGIERGIYTGEEVTFIDNTTETPREITGYKWAIEGNDDYYFATPKRASEIYYNIVSDGDYYSYQFDFPWFYTVYTDSGNGYGFNLASLDTDKALYIPQLNAPDSEQAGNANYTIIEDSNTYIYNYLGEKHIHCADGDYITHLWLYDDFISDIDNWRLTKNSANESYSEENMIALVGEYLWGNITLEGDEIYSDKTVAEFSQLVDENEEQWYYPRSTCQLNIVKYQREETIEEWDWANILECGSGESLEAGDNISIEDNKISAIGYKFDESTKSFTESPWMPTTEFVQDISLSQMGMSDLKVTGDAGALTYVLGGNDAAMFLSIPASYVLQFGLKLTNGDSAFLSAVDATNSTVTFQETLDATNALNEAQVANLLMDIPVYATGSANVTTYNIVDSMGMFYNVATVGSKVLFDDFGIRTIVALDEDNSTITVDTTLDENNNVNAKIKSVKPTLNNATGDNSHAEGFLTNASGYASHSECNRTTASGANSHAEGNSTTASGETSHAEGISTIAEGNYSHAEGYKSQTTGKTIAFAAHAEGSNTIAQNYAEHAEGTCNVSHKHSNTASDGLNTIHSIGIGQTNARKNAIEVLHNGDMYIYGVGGYQGTNTHTEDQDIDSLQMYLSGMETYIAALEQRIYNLEHPTTIE